MGAKTLLTLEEFMALPGDGVRHELDQGEVITLPPPTSVHDFVVDNFKNLLSDYVRPKGLGRVIVCTAYLLSREPETTVRQPDVSYISKARVGGAGKTPYHERAPELAVEVVSPSDTAIQLKRKIKQYLDAGAKEVWVAYIETRTIDVHRPGGKTHTFEESDTLTTDLFPGWSAKVADFFDLG